MRRLFIISTLFLFIQTAFAYNPFWVHIDKRLIKSVVKLDRSNPQTVEQFFIDHKSKTEKEYLGFGWTMWTPGIGGGYIGISATFIYYHDSIVSYTIAPRMPDEEGLIKRYKSWYKDSFAFETDKILPFNYNAEKILRPMKEYKGTLTAQTVPHKILDYMTPNSGTMYGYAGGYGGHLLQNRKAFLQIKDSLTNDQVIFLMYSINPASRLTAIEYYLKHKDNFLNQTSLDEWVDKNFIEIPKVETLFGCLRESWDTRTLVYMYSTMKTDK